MRDTLQQAKLKSMKVKRREFAVLLLPCVALPLWALAAGHQNSAPKPSLIVRCKAESLRPEPSWKETDTRVTTAMQTADKGVKAQIEAQKYYSNAGGHTYRWYYNSRIEGIYQGRKQIFYSSTESNKWGCWFASSNGVDWNKHELRERFALRKLPAKATGLTYIIEAIAFKSTYVAGEEVGQKKISQMRRWKNFIGYGSHSIPLTR